MLKRLFRRKPPTLASVEAYALWASRYPAEAHNPFMRLEQAAMLALMPDLHGKRVLDVACGSGRYANFAAGQGAVAFACDNSVDMLRVGEVQRAAVATMEKLPYADGSIEVILCGLAIGHLPLIDRAIGEMGRVLKRGGWLVVSDVHPFQTQRGATRTFTATDGKTYGVEHYLHTMDAIERLLTENGLRLGDVRAPHHEGKPVVLAWSATKP
jgi:malonyl-CoA O-methyltransferase